MVILFFHILSSNMIASSSTPSGAYRVSILAEKEIAPQTDFSLRIVVRDSGSLNPVEGAPVEVTLNDDDGHMIAHYSHDTDRFGTVSPDMLVDATEGRGRINVTVGEGDDRQELTFPVLLRERNILQAKLLLENNGRRKYIAGRLRLLRKPFYSPLQQRKVSILINDSRGKTVYKKDLFSDDNGFCIFKIPCETGFYKGEHEFLAISGRTRISRKIELPDMAGEELQVSLHLDRASCVPGETITGAIRAALFDGRPAQGAGVGLDIAAYGKEKKILAYLERKTDENGSYRFKCTAPSSSGSGHQSYLLFEAKVTKGKRSGEIKRKVPLLSSPYFIILYPERKMLIEGESNAITLLSIDSDGAPYPLKAEILTTSFKREIDTGLQGYATFEYLPGKEKEHFHIMGHDGAGRLIEREFVLPVRSGADAIVVQTGKALYRKGEPVTLEIFSKDSLSVVYLDFLSSGQTVHTEAVELSGGYGKRSIIPEKSWGGLVCIRARGFINDRCAGDDNWIYISPREEHVIEAAAIKEKFIPGEILPLSLKVKRRYGETPSDSSLEIMLRRAGDDYSGNEGSSDLSGDDSWLGFPPGGEIALRMLLSSRNLSLEGTREKCARFLFSQLTLKKDASFQVNAARERSLSSFGSGYSPEESPEEEEMMRRFAGSAPAAPLRHEREPDSGILTYFEEKVAEGLKEGILAEIVADEGDEYRGISREEDLFSQFADNDDRSLEEAYLYEPLLKTASGGQLEYDMLLPPHNLDADLHIGSICGSGELSLPVKIYQSFLCEIPLFSRLVTQGDTLFLPVRLVNYSKEQRELDLEISRRSWFDLKGNRVKKILIGGNQEGFSFFEIDVRETGAQKVAIGSTIGKDYQEVRSDLFVLPRAVEVINHSSGMLTSKLEEPVSFPLESLGERRRIELVLYNSLLSQLKRGLESMQSVPAVTSEGLVTRMLLALEILDSGENFDARERSRIEEDLFADNNTLLSYESDKGGFSKLSGEASTLISTSYALLALSGMRKRYSIDDAVLVRNLKWLLNNRRKDGTWCDTSGSTSLPDTAFVLWSLLECGISAGDCEQSLTYVRDASLKRLNDYALALCALVMSRIEARETGELLKRLKSLGIAQDNLLYWKKGSSSESKTGDIETTAIAALALGARGLDEEEKRRVTQFIEEKKYYDGTWGVSRNTYFVAKALDSLLGDRAASGDCRLQVNGGKPRQVSMISSDRGIYKKVELEDGIVDGKNVVAITSGTDHPLFYQLAGKFYTPSPQYGSNIAVTRNFEKKKLTRGEHVTCSIEWSSHHSQSSEIVAVFVPVPWGLRLDEDLLEQKKRDNEIISYEVGGDELSLFLKDDRNKIGISYTALFPCRITVRPVTLFYPSSPDERGRSEFDELEVR